MGREETSKFNKIAVGAILARAVAEIAELGVPDLIEPGSSRHVAELAAASGSHERALYRTLRFLASNGIFEERDERSFALTPMAEALRSDAPHSYRPAGRMFRRLFNAIPNFDHTLKTGESALTKTLGKPLFDYMQEDAELAAIFDASMSSIHSIETQAIVDAYDFGRFATVADLGGGNGSLLIALLAKFPTLQGILMDLPHVAERARPNIEAAGLSDRCTIQHVDFFKSVPGRADCITMRHIIHDWDDDQSVAILRNCCEALKPNGRLIIIEPLIPPGNDPSPAKDMDIRMMTFPGGMERTEAEYRELFDASGFVLDQITPTSSPVSLIEARPA